VAAVRPWVFACAVTALVLLCATHPRAAAPSLPIELGWDAPDDCPRAAAFEAAVSRLVGSASSSKVRAKVRITKDDTGGYTLRLSTELNELAGERTLQGRVCQLLVDAAAVTVALILNPNIEIASEGETPTGPNAALPPAEPARPAVVVPVPLPAAPSAATPVRWLGTGALGLAFGVFPRPIPDVSLGLGLASPKYVARFSASYSPPKDVYLAEPSNVGGRLWLLSLKMAGCWTAAVSAPRIGACFEGNWTRMQGDGLNVPVKRRAVTNWFAPGLGVFADLQLTPYAMFELAASVAVPIYRPDMHLDLPGATQIIQRPEVLTGNLQAGVIVLFN
jgi:hypothetical protein